MTETLLTPSSIKLYGRVIDGLDLQLRCYQLLVIARNNFLEHQLRPQHIFPFTGTTPGPQRNKLTQVNAIGGLARGMDIWAQRLPEYLQIMLQSLDLDVARNNLTISEDANGSRP